MSSKNVDSPATRHPVRSLTALLLVCEALVLVGLAGYSATVLPNQAPGRGTFAVGLALFFATFAVLLGLGARSLLNKGRFGVSFSVTWQLFQALVGASLLERGLLLPGAIALLLAIVMFVLLLRPENRPDRQSIYED